VTKKTNYMRLALASAALLLAAACGGNTPAGPGEIVPEGVSPGELLRRFMRAFNERDAALLETTLDAEFSFHMRPEDVGTRPPGGTYVIPEFWTGAEFLNIARHMFDRAYAIDFWLSPAGVEPEPPENRFRTTIPVNVLVMTTESNGYRAEGYCNMDFQRGRGEESDVWRLGAIWDFTGARDGAADVRPISLGRLLAIFH
jgi:hypothetical protein